MINDPSSRNTSYLIPLFFEESPKITTMSLDIQVYHESNELILITISDVKYSLDYSDDELLTMLYGVVVNGVFTKNTAISTMYKSYIIEHIDAIIEDAFNNNFSHTYLSQLTKEQSYYKVFSDDDDVKLGELVIRQLHNVAIVYSGNYYVSNIVGMYKDGKFTLFEEPVTNVPEILDEIDKFQSGQYNLLDRNTVRRELSYLA